MTIPHASLAQPRLLLIDDDEISREVLSMMLEMHGFPIDTAADGAEAIQKLEHDSPEVILMDTQMPGLSGLDLIDTMRKSSTARIIAISGSEVSEAIRIASDGFLLKPVEAEHLVALLAVPAQMAIVPVQMAMTATTALPLSTNENHVNIVIDPAVLGRLTAMMPASSVREIYDAVAADLKKRLDLMQQAMAAGDSGEVGRLAHSIKGGSAMVGFCSATEAAGRLEISNLRETWPKELTQLRDALGQLERILGGEFPT